MSTIDFTIALAGQTATQGWSQIRLDMAFSSAFGSQGVEVSTPLWAVTLNPIKMREDASGAWKSLLMSLRGQTKQLSLWDLSRPEPVGTMRGTMTLNSAAAQGATTLSIIASGEVSKTLLQGDLLGIGSTTTQQVVMVTADATSDGSGIISVTIEPPLRNAFSGGATVTWDKPKALFRRTQSASRWDYESVFVTGFSLDLIEDIRT